MRLSKREAAQQLGISIKTLDKKCKAGLIQFEKEADTINDGWRGHARVWVFLPDPVPVPSPGKLLGHADVRPAPQYDDLRGIPPEREPASDHDARDRNFAERYLSGEATDSLGNRNDATRKSLLGPTDAERIPEPRSNPTSHMDPALLGTPGNERIENPIDSNNYMELLHPGHKERMAELYRSCGVRPLSEQQEKQRADKIAIHAAFRWAR